MKTATLLVAAVVTLSSTAWSQAPIRANLLGTPRVGRPAPPITLPYATAAERRAPSAEFRSASELGRVVVIAFGGRPEPALRIDWAALARRTDSLGSPRIVLVGVARAGMAEAQLLSGSLGGTLKVLADSGGRVHRQYGVSERDRGWTIVVVADDGTLVGLERVATLADGKWWPALAGAVARGITAPVRDE